eukprot:COSAG02_NODE_728_length_17995_cov_52.042244_7_plen_81_part_00
MSATTTSAAAKHNNGLTAKQPYDALPGGDGDGSREPGTPRVFVAIATKTRGVPGSREPSPTTTSRCHQRSRNTAVLVGDT